MSAIHGKNTGPEKIVRSLLHGLGYRFRLHAKDVPGKPDIVFRSRRKVVFVNGCFWHGHVDCKKSALPVTNPEFWEKKINTNKKRDAQVRKRLQNMGWEYLDVWQCQISKKDNLAEGLIRFLEGKRG